MKHYTLIYFQYNNDVRPTLTHCTKQELKNLIKQYNLNVCDYAIMTANMSIPIIVKTFIDYSFNVEELK